MDRCKVAFSLSMVATLSLSAAYLVLYLASSVHILGKLHVCKLVIAVLALLRGDGLLQRSFAFGSACYNQSNDDLVQRQDVRRRHLLSWPSLLSSQSSSPSSPARQDATRGR